MPNLPDLRRRILADEPVSIEELREAVEYQIAIRKVIFEKQTAKAQPSTKAQPSAKPAKTSTTSKRAKPTTPLFEDDL
jgi:hypothetical protein